MLLTAEQLHEIRGIIHDYHQAYIVNAVSPNAVTPDVLARLKAKGLVNVQVASIEDAYLYGQILAMMEDPKFAGMSYADFKRHVQKNPIPLNDIERQAVRFAELQGAQAVRGLGNKAGATVGSALIEADAVQRAQLKEMIRTKTAENIAKREQLRKLKSEMGWASGDWTRDLQRIANTEKQNAMQRGVADHYTARYGADVMVAKRAMPDACKHCKRLHNGPDGHPRIFKLSELEANGTNVGRKAADWLPVVGTVHPHCQCQMIRVPAGWGFNREGELEPGAKGGKVYRDEGELKKAMLQEMDLQKAFQTMGSMTFQGLPITIENKVGTVRKWRDGEGGTGETHMLHAYGFIKRTRGDDEDELDCYIGPDPQAAQAYIIHQQNPATGLYDEAKVMLGFSNAGDARLAYNIHYNRRDFELTCSPMDMDAFKRWIRGTEPDKGEMMKSGRPTIAHVIPLEPFQKARVTKELATSESSSPQARGSQGPGSAVNYLFNIPEHDKPGPVEGIKETLEKLGENQDAAVKRDPEVYNFMEPIPKVVRPVVLPDNWPAGDVVGTGETEERREQHEKFWIQNRAPIQNTVDPEDQDKDELEKGGTPIGGMTPGGYIKVAEGKYIKPGEHVPEGSKVSPHAEGGGKYMLKVPLAKKTTLEATKAKFGLPGDIITGSKYAMLAVTAAGLESLHEAEKVVKEKKAKAAPKVPKTPKTVPLKASEIHRIGDLTLVHESELTPPDVHPNVIQRGTEVEVQLGPQKKTGKLLGSDFEGRPLVEIDGQRRVIIQKKEGKRVANWGAVTPVQKSGYVPTYSGLPEGALVRADARQQKLVKSVMKEKVVGTHTANEYTNWLRSKGQEVYLVGGIVRDLVAGTHEEAKDTDAEVREKMKDIDIVSTGHPGMGSRMLKSVAPELPNGGLTTNAQQWGVVRSVGKGLGLDYSSMASGGTYEEAEYNKDTKQAAVPADWDHDLVADAKRRDFTCNCLYYDTFHDVIVDPTGTGLADAQNKVLRLAPSPEDAMENNGIFVRFWKFRARGYKTEEETLKFVRKHAEFWLDTFKKEPHKIAKMLYGAVGKSGDPTKNLKELGKLMKADGCEDLWNKYVAPNADQIIAHAKQKGPES